MLRDHCDLYNAALMERREAWRMRHVSVTYGVQSAQLKAIRRVDPDGQGRHSFTAQQQTLRRLNAVFAAFYERCKAVKNGEKEKKPGYPRFKPYGRFDQVMFVAGDGAKWTPAGSERWARAQFRAVGSVKVRQYRQVRGTVKMLQLKREHRRWYVIVITETEPVPLPPAERQVGVDVGVARFLTTSDGEVVKNPRFLDASAEVIANLERRKARATPGSGNRKRIRRALAREWRKVRNRRRDFHHKTARALVNECDVIALEDLDVAGMTRRPAPSRTRTRPGASFPTRLAPRLA
jgi:putative transposase